MTTELTEALATFALETPSPEIPPTAIEKEEKGIADTIGCILTGSASNIQRKRR